MRKIKKARRKYSRGPEHQNEFLFFEVFKICNKFCYTDLSLALGVLQARIPAVPLLILVFLGIFYTTFIIDIVPVNIE